MSTASAAMTRLHIEEPDDGPSDDVFLILRLRVIVNHPPATVWTLLRQRNRNLFIHMIGNCTECPRAVIQAFLASRPLRIRLLFFCPFIGAGTLFTVWKRSELRID